MFDLTSPESTAVLAIPIIMAFAQWGKERTGLEGTRAELLALAIGAITGGLWFAAWHTELVADGNTALLALGAVLAVAAFALVPSGLYKLTFAAAGRR